MRRTQLNVHEAYEKVCQYVANEPSNDAANPLVVLEDPDEYDFGWVFYFNFKRFLETRDDMAACMGCAPIIVNRFTGDLVMTGTARETSFYVDNYIETGDPDEISPLRIIRYTRQCTDELKQIKRRHLPLSQNDKEYLGSLLDALQRHLTFLRSLIETKDSDPKPTDEMEESWLLLQWEMQPDQIDFDTSLLLSIDQCSHPERWTQELLDEIEDALGNMKGVLDDIMGDFKNRS